MKIKNKIALTLLPLVLLSILLINTIFGLFFQRSIDNQEQNKINSAEVNIATFINEQSANYIGTVYDWGNWDDTYNFINTGSANYVDLNLTENTFENLDLNFLIMINNDHSDVYKQYYSSDKKEFTEFPEGFIDSIKNIAGYLENANEISGIFKIGNSFYFTAETNVTDSTITKPSNGKLMIGKEIDRSIIEKIERISGCTLSSIALFDNSAYIRSTSTPVVVKSSYLSQSEDLRLIELVVPNSVDQKSSVILTLAMPRVQFLSAIKEMKVFAVFNTIGCFAGSVLIIMIFSRYLSNPISRMVQDIKSIDLSKNKFIRLSEKGKDEFAFLSKSINMLLSRIEVGRKILYDNKEELYATLISVGEGVIVVDKDEKIKFMNPVALNLTGWKIEDAEGKPLDMVFNIINEYSRIPVDSPVKEVFRTDAIIALSNHTLLISKDGSERAIEDTAAPIKDAAGITNGCVLVFKDTSERKAINRRIEFLSYHDQLTGLYNRRYFENELKALDTETMLPFSIIYADVNGLKIINDAFGHESGDEVIRRVADILTSVCGEEVIVARVGGDEFVALLPRTGENGAEQIVKLLREKTNQLKYMDIEVSVSFGWATKFEACQPALDVLRNAEDIMYQKKLLSSTSKRNGVIKSILNTLHIKCPRELAHSQRVSSICESIGTAFSLNNDDIKELTIAGELHDIGKIAIDEAILNKTESLTKSEWSQILHHPEIGFRLLGATSEFNNIAEYVLAHHEKWDGTGYPKGLKGNEISWKARVISIADSYDAMTCERPYRKAMDPIIAAEEIKKCAGTQFDPEIAQVFVEKVLKLQWS